MSVRRVVDWNGWRRPLGCGINNNKLQWTGSNGGGFKFQKEIILKESQKRWNDIYAAKIELLGMNQNYFQGQNKNIFNMRIWTYLIITLFDYYQIEIISISLHPLQTSLVNIVLQYNLNIFWCDFSFLFLWTISFVSKGTNLSFLSVKLWIIQNDQLRP